MKLAHFTYVKAFGPEARIYKRQVLELLRKPLATRMELAPSQQGEWNFLDGVINSTNRKGNKPTKLSWHPWSGELLLGYNENHVDTIDRDGSHPYDAYVRAEIKRGRGRIICGPWLPNEHFPSPEIIDYVEDDAQKACFRTLRQFKTVLRPKLPEDEQLEIFAEEACYEISSQMW